MKKIELDLKQNLRKKSMMKLIINLKKKLKVKLEKIWLKLKQKFRKNLKGN